MVLATEHKMELFESNKIELAAKEQPKLRAGASPMESEVELFWSGYPLKENGAPIGLVSVTPHNEGAEGTFVKDMMSPGPSKWPLSR